MVDPIGILLELGFDLDDISTDEGYLSALKEAIATIVFKTGGSGDEISSALFFFKQKTAYEIMPSLVGSEMCIRDRPPTIWETSQPPGQHPAWAAIKQLGKP